MPLVQSTKRGEIIKLPGTDVTINSADYVGAPVKGRKVPAMVLCLPVRSYGVGMSRGVQY